MRGRAFCKACLIRSDARQLAMAPVVSPAGYHIVPISLQRHQNKEWVRSAQAPADFSVAGQRQAGELWVQHIPQLRAVSVPRMAQLPAASAALRLVEKGTFGFPSHGQSSALNTDPSVNFLTFSSVPDGPQSLILLPPHSGAAPPHILAQESQLLI